MQLDCRPSQKGPRHGEVFCNKMRQDGSAYCPKHELFFQDSLLEGERQTVEKETRKQQRALRVAELSQSPLRAHNPKFDAKDKPVRMDAE